MYDTLKLTTQKQLHRLREFYQQHPKRALIILAAAILAFILLHILIGAIFHKKRTIPAVPVAVAVAKIQNVPVYFSALGTVTPDYTVTVKTQINGTLIHVYFKDGQYVKAGDVLAEIDPRPYQAQLLQYEGQLTRDEALLANAKLDLRRYQKLYKSKSVSQQTLNTQQSLVKQYEGTVKIDQGQIDGVKTNLSYCKITSPVSGRIGIGIIDQGNFVQTSDTTGIAVITTLDPISVYFSLPEDNVPAVTEQFSAGKKLIADAYNRDQNKLLASGILTAIDNQVDTSTGTVKFKAQFNNQRNTLFPNQFVNINLQVTTLQNAVIVPTAAVQQGAQGPYVYRYNQNHTVSNVPVKTSVTYGENTVITSGIAANQIVVTEGTDKLIDGSKVAVTGSLA